MDNKFFKFLSNFIELTKKDKEKTFYLCIIFFCVVLFIFKQYIATSVMFSYYIQKNMKKHEKFIKSKNLASVFLILVFFVFLLCILIFRNNIFLFFFSSMFIILLFFCYVVCFLACYYKNQYQAKKALIEAVELIIFRNDGKYSESLNEFINSLFLNLTIVTFLIYLVSLLKNCIPDIDKVISESYLVPYVTVLIVKIIDFLKEKVLEIE